MLSFYPFHIGNHFTVHVKWLTVGWVLCKREKRRRARRVTHGANACPTEPPFHCIGVMQVSCNGNKIILW